MRLVNAIVMYCFVSLCAGFLSAAEPAVTPALPDNVRKALDELPKEAKPEQIRVSRGGAIYVLLPNGAELIVQEKRSAPVIAVQVYIRTGAIFEEEWLGDGISHFAEHLMFKGSNKHKTLELDQIIRGSGGDDNAWTSNEMTMYHIAAASSGFETTFDALADMVMDSTFPPDEAKKEHGVVTKEIERSIDNPDNALWQTMDRLRYQVHPYRIPVLGYPERFAKVTRDEVWAYYKRRYAPQRATFVAVGDFDAAKALPFMAQIVAKWARTTGADPAIPEEPEQVAPRSVEITHPLCQVPKVALTFPSVSIRSRDLYALDVLSSIAGDGRASRLYKEVKDNQKLALEIGCWDYTPMSPGSFQAFATVAPGNEAATRDAMLAVLYGLRDKPPTAEELERAKKKVYTQRIYGEMTTEGVANSLGNDWTTAGDLDFSRTYVEKIQQVTAEDVVRVAKQYLVPQRLNVVIIRPDPKNAEGKPAPNPGPATPVVPKDDPAKVVEALKANPNVESVTTVQAGTTGTVYEVKLKNGLHAVLKPDYVLPVVQVSLVGLGGQRWEAADKAGSGALFATMLNRGTKALKKTQIAELCEKYGASVEPFGGRNSFGLNMRCLREDVKPVFELATSCLLDADFPEEEVKAAKEETLNEIEAEDEELWTINEKIFNPLIYAGHPYARLTHGTKEGVEATNAEDLRKLHARWVRPDNISVAVAGDIEPVKALELLLARLGALKAPAEALPAAPPLAPLAQAQTGQQAKKEIEGALLNIGVRGVDLKHPDRDALDVIASALSGLGGRLPVIVREHLGAAYSVGASNSTQLDGGVFSLYVQTDPTKLTKLEEVFRESLKKFCDEPMPEDELKNVKNFLDGQDAVAMQDLGDLSQRLALAQLYGTGAKDIYGHSERLAKLTAAQIQEVARKYLSSPNWVKTTVVPETGK